MPRKPLTDAERRRGARLAAAIKARRLRTKTTQDTLAEAAGIPLDTLRALETAARRPRMCSSSATSLVPWASRSRSS